VLISDVFGTLYRNMMRFGSVTP